MDDFEKYMTPPEEPSNRAYLQDGWLHCPYCGKKIFPVRSDTEIRNLEWMCKNSKCKKNILINKNIEIPDIYIDKERLLAFINKLSEERLQSNINLAREMGAIV